MNRAGKYYRQGIATKTIIIIGIVIFVVALLVIEGVSHIGRSDSTSTETQEAPQWRGPLLVLPNWGVEIPLQDDSSPYTVIETEVSADGTVTQYGVTFVRHQDLEGCTPDGPDFAEPAVIGFIDRNPRATASSSGTEVTVNGITYVYTPLGSLDDDSWMCARTKDGKDQIRKAANDFPTLLDGLRAQEDS